jgi:hypothetical protein
MAKIGYLGTKDVIWLCYCATIFLVFLIFMLLNIELFHIKHHLCI